MFIEAHRRYYAFDLAPGFWSALAERSASGEILSLDRVLHEIAMDPDELAEWTSTAFASAFAPSDGADVIAQFAEIMTWITGHAQYSPAAKAEFARVADGWLVAYAKLRGCTLVTHEVHSPLVIRKVPIPNVCLQFDVPYTDTFKMLRALNIRIG